MMEIASSRTALLAMTLRSCFCYAIILFGTSR
jgi:hypothetical protein